MKNIIVVASATGQNLNFLVTYAENWLGSDFSIKNFLEDKEFFADLIEDEGISLTSPTSSLWEASINGHEFPNQQNGASAMEAAYRCYVVSVLGGQITVPDELLQYCDPEQMQEGMATVSVSTATQIQLNWLIAKHVGIELELRPSEAEDISIELIVRETRDDLNCSSGDEFDPVNDWSQGGPIFGPALMASVPDSSKGWVARPYMDSRLYTGISRLEAGLRCVVAMEYGEEAQVPKELVN